MDPCLITRGVLHGVPCVYEVIVELYRIYIHADVAQCKHEGRFIKHNQNCKRMVGLEKLVSLPISTDWIFLP